MDILLAEHQGFCYGVKRAIQLAEDASGTDHSVVTLGPIIHNPQMVKHLEKQGVGKIDSMDEVQSGTVIIRSHGVGPVIYDKLQEKKLAVIDATCPHVKQAQKAADELQQQGRQVVIVGEKKHPEVQSIIAWAKDKAITVETLTEAKALPEMGRVGVVAQTTFSGSLFEEILAVIQQKSQDVEVRRTICMATDQRQEAAKNLADRVQVVLVVGGKNSANTTRLAEICQSKCSRVYHIETAEELQPDWFDQIQTVGITAGASTPEWIIKEVVKKLEEMKDLSQDLSVVKAGTFVKGKVVSVTKDEVYVDLGYKVEGVISLKDLSYPVVEDAQQAVAVGEEIDVFVIGEKEDQVLCSKLRADRQRGWRLLQEAFDGDTTITLKVSEVVKGGLVGYYLGVRVFIPASHVDVAFVDDISQLVGQEVQVKMIEVQETDRKAVASRKAVLQEEKSHKEAEIYQSLKVGQIVKGTVRRMASFGAFVDIGGVDGLVHVSDMAWQRVAKPEEIVEIGQEVEVMITQIDVEAKRLRLSMKQVGRDPWLDKVETLKEGQLVEGKVTKLVSFGAFVEVAPGLEGLVHLSELAQERVSKAEDVLTVGQEVKVKVLTINKENKKLGLSLRRAQDEIERQEYGRFLDHSNSLNVTIGDKLGHLFKHND